MMNSIDTLCTFWSMDRSSIEKCMTVYLLWSPPCEKLPEKRKATLWQCRTELRCPETRSLEGQHGYRMKTSVRVQ